MPAALASGRKTMFATFVELLEDRAQRWPDELAYLFLIDGEQEGPRLSYAELATQARSIARALRSAVGEQERALLIYPPGLDFVAAFYGCLYAGVIAVPVYPPRPDFLRPGAQSLAAFAKDCRPAAILGTAENLADLRSTLSSHPALSAAHVIATDSCTAAGCAWHPPPITPDWPAMLQYTSGSTTAPRGVMVSHANLLHNEELINTAFEHKGPGLGVCWLPPYHDMGLIGGILQAVYHPAPCVMMSPVSFLQKPLRWLAAVSRYRADTSGGPGFAFELCVQRITPEERKSLDLSPWSIAVIGSEPVRPETLEQFSAAFGPSGFRHTTWYPCYGLAEGTLFVAGGGKYETPAVVALDRLELASGRAVAATSNAIETRLVGCGHAWGGQQLAIVDLETNSECEPGHVGEIWLAGPSVALGYWGREDETRITFHARLASGEGPFLRTGDLGFVQNGELFITGRLKDLIIIRGRNHAPQDIEETVQAVLPALRVGCGAAFEVWHSGQPKLVVVQEVNRRSGPIDRESIMGSVRETIQQRHELHLHELVLVQSGSIPKTSSGKVQRHACRAAYEAGSLPLWNPP